MTDDASSWILSPPQAVAVLVRRALRRASRRDEGCAYALASPSWGPSPSRDPKPAASRKEAAAAAPVELPNQIQANLDGVTLSLNGLDSWNRCEASIGNVVIDYMCTCRYGFVYSNTEKIIRFDCMTFGELVEEENSLLKERVHLKRVNSIALPASNCLLERYDFRIDLIGGLGEIGSWLPFM
nr:hypothetical protein Iba_chr14aCG10150 [Ipomoea batatas]